MSCGCLLTPGRTRNSTQLDVGSGYPFEVGNEGESTGNPHRFPV